MKPDRYEEPIQNYIKKMPCPECKVVGKVQWAIFDAYRLAAETMEEECYLQCRNCGHDLESDEYPFALHGLSFVNRDWAIIAYDIEVGPKENDNVEQLTLILRPTKPLTRWDLSRLMFDDGILTEEQRKKMYEFREKHG